MGCHIIYDEKEITSIDFFQGLISKGFKMRYGNNPDKHAYLRYVWERKHIIDTGLSDYYLMASWLFRVHAHAAGIEFWARGAMPSSIICYCLGLTEIDPLKYGLHSVRFVNDEKPKFQFDIERSRYDEFIKIVDDVIAAESELNFISDAQAICDCILKGLSPVDYLSKKKEKPMPEDLEDEIARDALIHPDTIDMYDAYMRRKSDGLWTKHGMKLDKILAPTCGFVVYQEQMLDILCQFFRITNIEANQIRLSIQRGETEQMEAYKKELFSNPKDISEKKAEWLWEILTSNPNAFLKAHAVSRVFAKYKYEF